MSIDSGTLGAQAKMEIIIPKKTATYNDSDPQEKDTSIPMCTLRHFPNLIEHCIEWSRDKFNLYFTGIISDVRNFYENFDEFKAHLLTNGTFMEKLSKVKAVKKYAEIINNKDYDELIKLAVMEYTENFQHNIELLIYNRPEDMVEANGRRFWSGERKMPHPIKYDISNPLAVMFVYKYVQIINNALNLNMPKDVLNEEYIKKVSGEIAIPAFTPKEVKIANTDADKVEDTQKLSDLELCEKEFKSILETLKDYCLKTVQYDKMSPEIFEKDNDANGHIDFVHAASNLRASNYNIENCDRNKTKTVAGKIIPAIATSTAAITGLVCLQLYTLLQTREPKYFRNSTFNLATNFIIMMDLNKIRKKKDSKYDKSVLSAVKCVPEGFNVWDVIELKEKMTIEEFRKYMKDKYNVDVETVIVQDQILFDEDGMGDEKLGIEEAYYACEPGKKDEDIEYLFISIIGSVRDCIIEEEKIEKASADVPRIKYYLQKDK